jgi:hypothetical protein
VACWVQRQLRAPWLSWNQKGDRSNLSPSLAFIEVCHLLWLLLPEHVRVRRLLCLTGMWINGRCTSLALPRKPRPYLCVHTRFDSMYGVRIVHPTTPFSHFLSCLAAPGPSSLFSNQVMKQRDCRDSARPLCRCPLFWPPSTIEFYMKILISDTIVGACRDSRLSLM